MLLKAVTCASSRKAGHLSLSYTRYVHLERSHEAGWSYLDPIERRREERLTLCSASADTFTGAPRGSRLKAHRWLQITMRPLKVTIMPRAEMMTYLQ